jgi:hypothetical protein
MRTIRFERLGESVAEIAELGLHEGYYVLTVHQTSNGMGWYIISHHTGVSFSVNVEDPIFDNRGLNPDLTESDLIFSVNTEAHIVEIRRRRDSDEHSDEGFDSVPISE